MDSAKKWDFFLAYANPDKAAADELYSLLHPDRQVFLDHFSLSPGVQWDLEIPRAQRASRATVVLVSSRSQAALFQREEISVAIALFRKDASAHRVLPVYLDGSASTLGAGIYGLRLFQGLDVLKEGGLAAVARKLCDLSTHPSSEVSSETPQPETSPNVLERFPRGPVVDFFRVSRSLIEAYAMIVRPTDAAMVVGQANALRIEADADDPDVTYIKLFHLPPPETVPPFVYWSDVFSEACRHGPRMLGAVLLSLQDTQFSARAKDDRQKLLQYLKTPH